MTRGGAMRASWTRPGRISRWAPDLQHGVAMCRTYIRRVASLGATAAAVLAVACGEAPADREEAATSTNAALTQCRFAVTRNVYDGPSWWGTIGATNMSSASVTGVSVSFG